MRFGWTIVQAVVAMLMLAIVPGGMRQEDGAAVGASASYPGTGTASPTATAGIDYGATMTVVAERRNPDPAVQQAWETYFTKIGTAAASAPSWPAGLTFEFVDVDFDFDRNTQVLGMISGEYELESPDNNSYASAVVVVQPSEAAAKDQFAQLMNGIDEGASEMSRAPEIGDESVCLLRQEGDAVAAYCFARVGDTLVSTLWTSDDEPMEDVQQKSAVLSRLLVAAMESVERPSR